MIDAAIAIATVAANAPAKRRPGMAGRAGSAIGRITRYTVQDPADPAPLGVMRTICPLQFLRSLNPDEAALMYRILSLFA